MTVELFITTPEDFKDKFNGDYKNNLRAKMALDEAIKARKEETELYWKRATYFWTLSAVAFTGFFTFSSSTSHQEESLLVIVCCIGFFFSFTWLLANRGAMQWLLNWHNHVFLLEDEVMGPLFKTIEDDSKTSYCSPFSGKSYSVVKLNQSLCFFLTVLWFFLLIYSWLKTSGICGYALKLLENNMHHILVGITFLWCAFNWKFGESKKGNIKEFKMKILRMGKPQESKIK